MPSPDPLVSMSECTFFQEVEEGLQADGGKRVDDMSIDSSQGSSFRSLSISTYNEKQSSTLGAYRHSKEILTALIILVGVCACAAFMSFGFHSTNSDMEGRFESQAEGITYHILSAWSMYEMFSLWIHQACHKHTERNNEIDPYEDISGHLGYCSRDEFRRLYEYISSQGVDFLSVQLLKNITHGVREAFEMDGKAYFNEKYPEMNYRGITEQEWKPEGGFDLVYRKEAEYYMPIHYVEPVYGNEVAIDLDKLAAHGTNNVIQAVEEYRPVLSPRMRLIQETEEDAYGVILAHPGVRTSLENVTRTNSISQVVIRMPYFLEYALQSATEDKDLYVYDSTDEAPVFLGAVQVHARSTDNAKPPAFKSLPEVELVDIRRPRQSRYFERELDVAGRKWTIAMVSTAHEADMLFVVLGGTIIFAASLFCAAWFHSHLSRVAKINDIKSARAAEKAQIAKVQATRERDLNEFLAHEIRNPLSSAIACLSFIVAGVSEHVPDPKEKKSILEDVGIMDASLQFINELLRNMLDLHRARGRQIKLNLSPVDVRRDIMEPVAAILFMRGAKVTIEVDCPPDLAVMGDRMRLKQVALNLSSNSSKFVETGYIRLRAAVVDGSVQLSVEDSGPGIPLEKRDRLFAKFQESLDSLNQGTGIGLCVCKTLSELMGADIYLDEGFESGVDGCPGTRFVLRLNQPALEIETSLEPEQANSTSTSKQQQTNLSDGAAAAKAVAAGGDRVVDLPEAMSVLIVDDDTMIRKMFRRAALRVAPTWEIEEASNGETAVMITQKRTFDVIFMDQYMASVEKQMLGTETVRALRAKGVKSIICGLSANDMQAQFLESGANAFIMKPFPCKKDAMAKAFQEVLASGNFYDKIISAENDERKEQ